MTATPAHPTTSLPRTAYIAPSAICPDAYEVVWGLWTLNGPFWSLADAEVNCARVNEYSDTEFEIWAARLWGRTMTAELAPTPAAWVYPPPAPTAPRAMMAARSRSCARGARLPRPSASVMMQAGGATAGARGARTARSAAAAGGRRFNVAVIERN